MHALRLLPVLLVMTLALGAWASTPAVVAPTCTADDEKSQHVVPRSGYLLACGPGSAVVSYKRVTYRMKHSKCFDGAGLYFGVSSGARTSPTNGLYLVLAPHGKAGTVDVVDGGLVLASGVHATVLGTAHVKAGLRRGPSACSGTSGTERPMAEVHRQLALRLTTPSPPFRCRTPSPDGFRTQSSARSSRTSARSPALPTFSTTQ